MTLYTESVEDQTDHFTDAFVRENFVCYYDVVTTLWRFENIQLMPFCLGKSRVGKRYFNSLAAFLVRNWVE